MTPNQRSNAWLSGLRAVWQQRPVRERRLLSIGGMLLALLMVWQWGVASAWNVWHTAPVRQAELDAQTRQMLQWQAQAQSLQGAAPIDRQQAMTQLQTQAQHLLGPGAQLQPQGEQWILKLNAAPASGLAQWLALAREKAKALPQKVQLQRLEASASTPTEVAWQGTLVLRLP